MAEFVRSVVCELASLFTLDVGKVLKLIDERLATRVNNNRMVLQEANTCTNTIFTFRTRYGIDAFGSEELNGPRLCRVHTKLRFG